MNGNKQYDYLIVGSGLFGATFARLATDAGCRCLVIEKRPHTGGNVHCENISGITVHSYGAHIFHTSDKGVWEFVNSLVPFNRFTNSPVALAPDGNLYNLPFNMNTFRQLWGVKTPKEAMAKLEEQRSEAASQIVGSPANLEEQALMLVGRDIYEQLIKGYTEKQWGRPCTQLPPFIIKRLPVRLTYDNNYFNDKYQGIPIGGYNPLIDRLLEGSEVLTDTDFFADRARWEQVADKIVFTGRIDEFYGYRFGPLEYRSLRFETWVEHQPNHQGNAVWNYTDAAVPFTRIIEHKHFESFGDEVYKNPATVLTREFPAVWSEGMEPFYPVNDAANQAVYEQYKTLSDKETNVIFGGRLAQYRYYDMAPVIAEAIHAFEQQKQ